MAEVVTIPKPGNNPKSSLSRETSSLVSTQQAEQTEKVKLKGTVVEKKPGFGTRLKETFIAEDARDVGDYIVWDILIPTIKRTIRDIIVGSADRIFLGTSTAPSSSSNLYRDRGVTRVRTDYASRSRSNTTVETRTIPSASIVRSGYRVNDFEFETRDDAEFVWNKLLEHIAEYGKVGVNQYFEMVGKSSDFTAQRWGWKDLTGAYVVNSTNGTYLLRLPDPVVIQG